MGAPEVDSVRSKRNRGLLKPRMTAGSTAQTARGPGPGKLGRCPPIPEESPFYAWADESLRIDQAAAPLYLMGAVIAETAVCHRPREQLRELHRATLSNHRNRFARTTSPADRRRMKDMQHKLH